MVKRNLLVWRGFIGCENPTNNVGPRSGSTHVRKLLEAEGLNDVVEVGSCIYRKAPEENSTGLVEHRVEKCFVVFDGLGEKREREGRGLGVWRENWRELNSVVKPLVWDLDFQECVRHDSLCFSVNLFAL